MNVPGLTWPQPHLACVRQCLSCMRSQAGTLVEIHGQITKLLMLKLWNSRTVTAAAAANQEKMSQKFGVGWNPGCRYQTMAIPPPTQSLLATVVHDRLTLLEHPGRSIADTQLVHASVTAERHGPSQQWSKLMEPAPNSNSRSLEAPGPTARYLDGQGT